MGASKNSVPQGTVWSLRCFNRGASYCTGGVKRRGRIITCCLSGGKADATSGHGKHVRRGSSSAASSLLSKPCVLQVEPSRTDSAAVPEQGASHERVEYEQPATHYERSNL